MKFTTILAISCCALFPLTPVLAKDKDKDALSLIQIPETPEGLWVQVDAQRKALGEAITAGNANGASLTAETLKALIRAVPSKYPGLAAEKRKSVHHETKAVGHLCDDVREAFAEKRPEQVAAILEQMDGAIKFVKGEVAPPKK